MLPFLGHDLVVLIPCQPMRGVGLQDLLIQLFGLVDLTSLFVRPRGSQQMVDRELRGQ